MSCQKQPLEVFYKKGVIRNFAKFTGKHLCQRVLFDKVAGLRTAPLLKRTVRHRSFPVNFAKFLRTPFFTQYLLLLYLMVYWDYGSWKLIKNLRAFFYFKSGMWIISITAKYFKRSVKVKASSMKQPLLKSTWPCLR